MAAITSQMLMRSVRQGLGSVETVTGWWRNIVRIVFDACGWDVDEEDYWPSQLTFEEKKALRRLWAELSRQSTTLGIARPDMDTVSWIASMFIERLPDVAADIALRYNLDAAHRLSLYNRYLKWLCLNDPANHNILANLGKYGRAAQVAEMLGLPPMVPQLQDEMLGDLSRLVRSLDWLAPWDAAERVRQLVEALQLAVKQRAAMWRIVMRNTVIDSDLIDLAFVIEWAEQERMVEQASLHMFVPDGVLGSCDLPTVVIYDEHGPDEWVVAKLRHLAGMLVSEDSVGGDKYLNGWAGHSTPHDLGDWLIERLETMGLTEEDVE